MAYTTADGNVHVARIGRAPATLALPGSNPVWGPNDSLVYSIDGVATAWVPEPGAPVHRIDVPTIAVSPDARRIAYSRLGDVVVAEAGGAPRIVASSTTDEVVAFAPDGEHVIARLDGRYLHAIALADGARSGLGLGIPVLPVTMVHDEVIATTTTELAAIDVVTGARRHLADLGDDSTVQRPMASGDRVVYGRVDNDVLTVRLSDDTGETELQRATHLAPCWPAGVAGDTIATPCNDTGTIVAPDGTARVTVPDIVDVLGLNAAGTGIVTIDLRGTIAITTANGREIVARAIGPRTSGSAVATYAP